MTQPELLLSLLNDSLQGQLSDTGAEELERLCQMPENNKLVGDWLRQEVALRNSFGSPSVARSLEARIQSRAAKPHQRPGSGRKIRWWHVAAMLAGTGLALAAVKSLQPAKHRASTLPVPDRASAPVNAAAPPDSVDHSVKPPLSAIPRVTEPDGPDNAAAKVSVDNEAEEVILRRFDFEDGQLPRGFTSGQIIKGMDARSENHFSIQGGYGKYAPDVRSVVYQPADEAIAVYDPQLELRFRVYTGAPFNRVRLQIYNLTQRQNYQYDVTDLESDRWNERTIRLQDMRPVRDTVRELQPKDQLTALYLMGGAADGASLLIDDLTLLRRSSR
ncbi:MAG: hypothetical protein SF187_09375 [Deltaproteobacteria bacterium]|nr:hypothetical protein [Deltaproteobacteria bacterium]